MLEVTYHPAVQEELTQYAVFYEEQSEGLGKRFLDEYDQAVADIQHYPEAWALIEQPYRCHQLRHFPHGIIYRILSGKIRILSVMHLHRRPGYWKGRE